MKKVPMILYEEVALHNLTVQLHVLLNLLTSFQRFDLFAYLIVYLLICMITNFV